MLKTLTRFNPARYALAALRTALTREGVQA